MESTLERRLKRTALPFRNPMPETSHVGSNLAWKGDDTAEPLITIAIPTYQRPKLLIEALKSALDQDFNQPFEILVADDSPSQSSLEYIKSNLPELAHVNFRYYIHEKNLKMMANFNRCIQLARGEWVTLLHDDDLLDRSFLGKMFSVLDKDSEITGLSCWKSTFYDIADIQPPRPRLHRRIASRALKETMFLGKATRKIPVKKFFFGPTLGNIVGTIFKRDLALSIGGFYPEDFPSDIDFLYRYSVMFDLRQHRWTGAYYRIAQNVSLEKDIHLQNLVAGYRLRQRLAEKDVPTWWARLSPLICARHRAEILKTFSINISTDELQERLGVALPNDRPILFRFLKFTLRGF